jgi:hypothetical protein
MKTILHLSLTLIILASLGATEAKADDEAVAALGGFVAGIITGSIIDHDRDRTRVHVYTDRSYGHRHDKGRYGHDWRRDHWKHRSDWKGKPSKRSGHWETRRVRVWVPGHWELTRNACGDRIKVWEPGHFIWKHEKVWVSYRDRRGGFCYRD